MKHLIVGGHGANDSGAVGNGTNERDFTRSHVLNKIARVINETDGHSATIYDKSRNIHIDTRNGGGVYWAKKNGFDTVTEIHLDAFNDPNASGGHVIIYHGFNPDKIDLGIRDTIKKYVGIRYNHRGHQGISGRDNLLQVNVCSQIGLNYRLVEMGFITSVKDMRNIRENIDAICEGYAKAITGGKPAKTKPSPSPIENDIDKIVNDVIRGKYGNGATRKKLLGNLYNEVQEKVNKVLSDNSRSSNIEDLAIRTIKGEFGNGQERRQRLGQNYRPVQDRVNEMLLNK